MGKLRKVQDIRKWNDAQRWAGDHGAEFVRCNGTSHEVWRKDAHTFVLCNKGNEDIKPGLRSAIIKAFIAAGMTALMLAVAYFQVLA